MASRIDAFDKTLQLMKWMRENFPYGNSSLSHQILMLLALYDARGEQLSMKELLLHLDEHRVRASQIIRQLRAEKWITMEPDSADHRVRLVVPAEKLRRLFVDYGAAFGGLMQAPPAAAGLARQAARPRQAH